MFPIGRGELDKTIFNFYILKYIVQVNLSVSEDFLGLLRIYDPYFITIPHKIAIHIKDCE
jgi:hypothetical protein